ncbi:sensor histidine kinase [Cytobacillus firmus]|uniref:sensor histidine kinase n=1 Tax=Cytobacillus firmus TaxID=1399 RepID=UPI0024953BB4|nr:HAMP domain-containing sensor histidine kinase [Cytobacillus firmus]
MKNNIMNLLRYLPKWKVMMYILLSLFLAVVMGAVLLPAVWFLEDNTRFFESLFFILSYFREFLFLVFYLLATGLFLLIFYQFERKRYLAINLIKVTEDVQQWVRQEHASEGFCVQPEFQALTDGIQKIIEKSEEAIKEVKRTEQLKNELVTSVAHDLRSPLTSIIGYLDLINNDRYSNEVELRHYVQIIHDKTSSLYALINDIFEFTYMQNQQIKLHKEVINIEEMLNQLAVQTKVQLEAAGMEFRLFSSVNDPVVEGDGVKLARVFENLIQNAIRYGSDGRYLDAALYDRKDMIEIEIANYGQTIPRIDIPHIFDRFYRVEKSRSQYTGGSGLGLAISKSIVDLHSGYIDVESAPGKTAFTIRLFKKYRSK